MKFESVHLENFKCYADADLTLDSGVTVIHGLNGSGKSSLLEACFFALYGAHALERTLDEVVTTGAEEATVELGFSHAGGDYHVTRRIRATGERAQTAECVLETPDGPVDGATDVRAYVADLLRMDAEAFRNCAYVRQGEVNKLINATPGERQDMIDELLQLGRLEEYRQRAHEAALGVDDVLNEARGELKNLREQVAEREDEDLHGRLNARRTELAEVEAERDRYEENREEAEETLQDARETLSEYEERRERLEELEETVDSLESAIAETESERDDLADAVEEHVEEVEAARDRAASLLAETDLAADDPSDLDDGTVEARVEEVEARVEEVRDAIQDARLQVQEHEADAESNAERAEELAARADERREEAAEREGDAEAAAETVAERRERLEELDAELAERRERLESSPVDAEAVDDHLADLHEDLTAARDRAAEARADLEAARERVEEAERLQEAGKCPECGQPVEGSPHVDALSERRERVADLEGEVADAEEAVADLRERVERADELRDVREQLERLESNRRDVRQLLEEKEAAVTEAREEAADLREEAADLDAEAEAAREDAAAARERAEAARSRIGELNGDHADVRARLETLADLSEAVDEAADAREAAERLREKRSMYADQNDERRERLADLRAERSDLREAVDEERLEAAREREERAASYLEEVEGELATLAERRDDVVGAVNRLESRIEDLESLREKRDAVADRVERLESLREETESLEAMYGDLRADLRRRNVDTLERTLNDTFELVYGNDSYDRIELSDAYELTVYQKDGSALDPEQLSGGERALFNLSLRCAVYRLLAEGVDGAAPMPPLVLDEPTVFLDSGHVSRLVDLVESMRDHGVEQILVVSHDEELVGAADSVVRVEKDGTTNRSRVERVGATPGLVGDD